MTWICEGLYAEGPTDYRFLVALLDNLLPQIATEALPEIPIVGQTVAIDARTPAPSSRAERIVAAIDSYRAECNLFVVHADADNDPEAAVRDRIHPGLALASQRWPDIALATCVPVRAIEAWMLVDPDVFVTQIEQKTPPTCRAIRSGLPIRSRCWPRYWQFLSSVGRPTPATTMRSSAATFASRS